MPSASPGQKGYGAYMHRNQEAKAFWSRLMYDEKFAALRESAQVGVTLTQVTSTRKSGAGAWSERTHREVVEVPFLKAAEQWGDAVPYHRIAHFIVGDKLAWPAPSHPSDGKLGSSPAAASLLDAVYDLSLDTECGDDSDDAVSSASPWRYLPSECWQRVALSLECRDLCALSQACSSTKLALDDAATWRHEHNRIFGAHQAPPGPCLHSIKRACVKSELRLLPWTSGKIASCTTDLTQRDSRQATSCIRLDADQAVSADGANIRFWSASSGNRFAAVKAAAPLRALAISPVYVAGVEPRAVRIWTLDDLRTPRVHRLTEGQGGGGGPEGPEFRGACFVRQLLVAAGPGLHLIDSDLGRGVMTLPTDQVVQAVASMGKDSGNVVAAGASIGIWDLEYSTMQHQLFDGSGVSASYYASVNSSIHLPLEPFTDIAVCGNVVAANSRDVLAIYDIRQSDAVAVVAHTPSSWPSSARAPSNGLHLDDDKLVLARPASVEVFDMRRFGCSNPTAALPPVTALPSVRSVPSGGADRRSDGSLDGTLSGASAGVINDTASAASGHLCCLAVHGERMVTGFANGSCGIWAFGQSGIEACKVLRSADAEDESFFCEMEAEGGRRKKGNKKPAKRQNRFPKRASR